MKREAITKERLRQICQDCDPESDACSECDIMHGICEICSDPATQVVENDHITFIVCDAHSDAEIEATPLPI